MSGHVGAAAMGPITLDELERLIKLLGMLGSLHDGEVVNAGRLAVKWLRDHQTNWEALLVPEPESGVVSVGVSDQDDRLEKLEAQLRAAEADRVQAYKNGFQAGLATMAAQIKAQAAAGAAHTSYSFNPGPQAGPAQSPPGATPTPHKPASSFAQGTWQWVAASLLDGLDDGSLPPGVFRGSREIDFVSDVLRRGYPSLTSAQENWLRDIASRVNLSW